MLEVMRRVLKGVYLTMRQHYLYDDIRISTREQDHRALEKWRSYAEHDENEYNRELSKRQVESL